MALVGRRPPLLERVAGPVGRERGELCEAAGLRAACAGTGRARRRPTGGRGRPRARGRTRSPSRAPSPTSPTHGPRSSSARRRRGARARARHATRRRGWRSPREGEPARVRRPGRRPRRPSSRRAASGSRSSRPRPGARSGPASARPSRRPPGRSAPTTRSGRSRRDLGAAVEAVAVREALGRDLDEPVAPAPRDLDRAVRRPRVDDDDLDGTVWRRSALKVRSIPRASFLARTITLARGSGIG